MYAASRVTEVRETGIQIQVRAIRAILCTAKGSFSILPPLDLQFRMRELQQQCLISSPRLATGRRQLSAEHEHLRDLRRESESARATGSSCLDVRALTTALARLVSLCRRHSFFLCLFFALVRAVVRLLQQSTCSLCKVSLTVAVSLSLCMSRPPSSSTSRRLVSAG